MAITTRKKRKSAFQLWLMLGLIVAIIIILFIPTGEGSSTTDEAQQSEQSTVAEAEEDIYAATTLAKEGMQAPDFTVEMFDGSHLTLSDLAGKVVLVNFWATWCPPCREELTRVEEELINRFKGREFVFLPISRGEERATVADFRREMNYSFAMGLDPERAIYDRYASNYIPRNFLIDRSGKVVLASIGYEPDEFEALINRIEELLNENN